jgi:hypothetical protein
VSLRGVPFNLLDNAFLYAVSAALALAYRLSFQRTGVDPAALSLSAIIYYLGSFTHGLRNEMM